MLESPISYALLGITATNTGGARAGRWTESLLRRLT